MALGTTGTIKLLRQHANGAWPTAWQDLPGCAGLNSASAVAKAADGRLFVARNKRHDICLVAENPAGTGWNGAPLSNPNGHVFGMPVATTNPDGAVVVLAMAEDGAVWSNSQTSTTGTAFAGWTRIGGNLVSPRSSERTPMARSTCSAAPTTGWR